MRVLVVLVCLIGCGGDKEGDTGSPDADGDGFVAAEDCNDDDPAVFPGAREACDEVDNDCDGEIDETAFDAVAFYLDGDGDGVGLSDSTKLACSVPSGYAEAEGDCDDDDPDTYPGAPEHCDGIDNDCDPHTDDDDVALDREIFYRDNDGDSYGDPDAQVELCEQPSGYVADDSDCNDGNGGIHPGAAERCGVTDEDCDPSTGDEAASDKRTWYDDSDEDGFGDPAEPMEACDMPPGAVADNTDCDDGLDFMHPGADELCNGLDDDCDAETSDDDGTQTVPWFIDADEDGYGDAYRSLFACDTPDGYVDNDADCDDTRDDVSPGEVEVCDAIDNDCDPTTTEEDAGAVLRYPDDDGDGYGDAFHPEFLCSPDPAYVEDGTDCNDGTPLAHPGLEEVCGDGLDNDCDGTATPCELVGDWAPEEAVLVEAGVLDAFPYGSAVGVLGDMDGDGFSETAIGVPVSAALGGSGAVRVGVGPVLEGEEALFMGSEPGDLVGSVVAGAGDLDGDGRADLVIGGPGNSVGGADAGAVYLVHGPVAAVPGALSSTGEVWGAAPGHAFGSAVAASVDADGDALPDLFVGAPGANAVYLFSGPLFGGVSADTASAIITSDEDAIGSVIASVDTSGDEIEDLIAGSPDAFEGAVHLMEGPFSGALPLTSVRWSGDAEGDRAGASLITADLALDGQPEIVVGAPAASAGAGAVYVVPTGAPVDGLLSDVATTVLVGSGLQAAGTALAVGDVDADGWPDLVVGGPGEAPGVAWLIYGPLPPSLDLAFADARILGEALDGSFGTSLTVGDIDDDAVDDILGGDPTANGGAGEVRFYLGLPGL
jgi:hypothetical protein